MLRQLLAIFVLLFFSISLYAQTVVQENAIITPPVANPTQILQGRLVGVYSTSANGRPGSPAISTIRGQNSIEGDSEPYYIVDGVPMTSTQLSAINMEDIESISVYKDAITTAIYGVNGGNGVIHITTKNGRRGPLRVTVSAEAGFSKILKNKFGLMNTQQKLSYEKDLGIIDQATYDARLQYDNDPMDEIYRTAWVQKYNLQLSGGNDRTTYYLSGGYYTQDGIHHNSDYNRYTINANIYTDMAKWLSTGMRLHVGKEENSYPLTTESSYSGWQNNLTLASILLNPYEQLKNADGSYNQSLIGYGTNPLYQASMFENERDNTNISGTGLFNIRFMRELNLQSSITLNQYESEEHLNRWNDSFNYYYSSHSDNKSTSTIQANKLYFTSNFDYEHDIRISLSQEYRITNGSLNESSSEGLNYSHSLIREYKNKILSGALELKYTYKNRLIFDATYRMDKVDLFLLQEKSTAKSWGIGAKWVAYDRYGAVSRITLRASTGKVAHLPLAFTRLSYNNPLAFSGSTPSLYNYSKPWETTQTHNVGVDAFFFDNRLYLYADLYHKTSSDVFIPMYIYTSEKGKVENKGFELDLNWYAVRHYKFYLNFSANLSLNQNKVKSLPYSELINGMQIIKEGKSLGGYHLARWAGVNSNTGEPMWYDASGNTTTSYNNASKEYIDGKKSLPSKTTGFSINSGYKGFSLNAYFYGIWDIYAFNENLYYIETSNGRNASMHNFTTNAADYWKNPGDKTALPAIYSGNYYDTRLLQNRSYLRLKSLTFSYDFNQRLLSRTRIIDACRVFVTADNLFTITGYDGFTPEVLGSTDYAIYPEARTFSFGIKLTFK